MPFVGAAVRVLVAPGPIFLSGDIAVFELDVRRAMAFHQSLGPYDRFGWHHPGPAYFYLLALPSWVFGSGARAELLGALLVAGVCASLSVWLVSRHAGLAAGLFAAAGVALLGYQMSPAIPGQPLGAVLGPWNPFVVTFPLVLLLVLCALACSGRPWALLAAAVVGTFVVQTDLSTLPLVVVGLVGASGVVVARQLSSSRPRPAPAADSTNTPAPRFGLVVGVGLLVACWVPPLVQQLTGHPGNLSAVVDFFTAHHRPQTLGAGLWAMLAVEAVPVHGLGQEMTYVLGAPHAGALVVLAALLAAAALTVGLGRLRRLDLAVALGAAGLLSFVLMALVITRVVGGLFGYLVVWAAAVPAVALVGLGVALVGQTQPTANRLRRALPVGLAGSLALVAAIFFCLRLDALAPSPAASDPAVAAAWRAVAPHLGKAGQPVLVGADRTDLLGTDTFFGLVAQLDHRGYQCVVPSLWRNVLGDDHVARGTPAVQVWLYRPSRAVEARPGFVVHTGHADVVVTVARLLGPAQHP